jgi:hypothetical protein
MKRLQQILIRNGMVHGEPTCRQAGLPANWQACLAGKQLLPLKNKM